MWMRVAESALYTVKPLSLNELDKLLTPWCPCRQVVIFGYGQRVVILCCWEGSRGLVENNGSLLPDL